MTFSMAGPRGTLARRRFLAAAASVLMLALTLPSFPAQAIEPEEERLIEQLITAVQNMHESTFIRNGMSYSADTAADHLRDKLAYFKNDIRTADDFIRLCATRSELTGFHYQVKDATGATQDAAQWLQAKLAQLRMQRRDALANSRATEPSTH